MIKLNKNISFNRLILFLKKYKIYIVNEYKNTYNLNHKNSVLNRSVAIMEAYRQLLETNNIVVLNSLTRMQIDN